VRNPRLLVVILMTALQGPVWAQTHADAVAGVIEALRTDPALDQAAEVSDPLRTAILIALDPEYDAVAASTSPITRYLARARLPATEGGAARLATEEALLAALSEAFTHDEILSLWAQTAYFGAGCFGTDAAIPALLELRPGEVTLADALTLVTLLPQPGRLIRDPGRLRLRYEELVRGGGTVGLLSPAEETRLIARGPSPLNTLGSCF
jgi:membrane peptidoglycan carboxypeptidase